MARELRRLLISPERLPPERLGAGDSPQALELEPAERHYLSRVLRLRPGDRFAVTDGAGHLWSARLAEAGAALEQPVSQPLETQSPPSPPLTLAVTMPKRDGEVMARMACELGIDALLPVLAERSSAGERLRSDRLEAILREAAEQCERLWLPALLPLQPAQALLTAAPAGVGLMATTRAEGLPLLDGALTQLEHEADQPLRQGVTLAIGPEGGWSQTEEALALAAGWKLVSLGPTILRVSTAAVAGTAALVRWRLGLTCPSCSSPSL
jgi:16S rRNA (uracil1498-N3)-methyltransferase